ncbi:hypothetical protein ACLX1H_000102 [Fusarium chlamydosporum]
MCGQPESQRQENGDKRQQSGCQNCTEASSTHNDANHNYHRHTETFYVPASQNPIAHDHDHRSMITIQSQQREWPQDIWFESPTQRVLYHPTLCLNIAPEDASRKMNAIETAEPKANGDASKGSST